MGDLEEVIYEKILDAYKRARVIKGNPIEWYAQCRLPLGTKTLLRRIAYGGWFIDELKAINKDLNDPVLSDTIKKQFDLPTP